jgi:8-oxo-dGTP diphosphatase
MYWGITPPGWGSPLRGLSHCPTRREAAFRHLVNNLARWRSTSRGRATIGGMLEVVAAAVVEDDRLLLVSKHEAPDVFYLPGGKRDDGESAEACLRRELAEELGATATSLEPFDVVHALAALERVPMRMTVYRATLDRAPIAAAEISSLRWYHPDEAFAGRLAPAVADHVIPALFGR